MQITLSQFAGFCDGVRRAFEIVSNIDSAKIKKPVFVLGSLVHNQDVVRKVEEKGIKKIDLETFLAAKAGEIGTIIITAHGVGPKIYEEAKNKNIGVIDTTCPRVVKVQRLAQNFIQKGYAVILIGDHGHKEVKSIYEWAGEQAVIIESEKDLEKIDIKNPEKIVVLSQTTQNRDFLDKAYKYIKNKYEKAEILDTICTTTNERQDEIKKMARNNDGVIVIGSPESANSNRLYEIAKKINKKSIFIEREKDLDAGWFSGLGTVAIAAGASTPDWVIEAVIGRLASL